MVIVAARNVIKYVKHVAEEPPQIARFVKLGIIRMSIMPVRDAINHA